MSDDELSAQREGGTRMLVLTIAGAPVKPKDTAKEHVKKIAVRIISLILTIDDLVR